MRTQDLIDQLSGGVEPRWAGAAVLRLTFGIAIGVGAAMLALLFWLGAPLSVVGVTGIAAFTMKLLFGVTLAALAAILLVMSGRPGSKLGKRFYWLLLPPAVVAVTATMELAVTPSAAREMAWLGSSWQACLIGVSLLSLPVLLGIAWGFSRLAPTDLRQTGFLAGLTSGAAAATLYALYCPETTASFLVTWYTLAITVSGGIGAITGPRLLRW